MRFSSRSENKDDRSVWIRMAEIYSTFPQNGIWPNLTGSKCSMSSISKFVFFRTNPKTKMTTLVSDWLRDFQLLLFNRLPNGIWQNLTFMKQVFNVFYQVAGVLFLWGFFFWRGGGGGIRGKQIVCTSCQLYGMPYLLWFPNCVARFKALPYFILHLQYSIVNEILGHLQYITETIN